MANWHIGIAGTTKHAQSLQSTKRWRILKGDANNNNKKNELNPEKIYIASTKVNNRQVHTKSWYP